MRFELPLVEQKIKPHQVTALHLIIAFSLCGMGAFSFLLGIYSKFWSTTFFQSGTVPTLLLLIVGLGLLSVTFFKNRWLQKPEINRSVRVFELVITATIAVFAALNEGWAPAGIFAMLTGAIIFAINWEKNTTKTLLIHVDKEGIKLPVISRKRSINWPDVNAVLLRYGTLTIDCADNSLYQWNISQINFDNQSFEEFCLQKIEEGKERRDKNDW